MDNKLPIPPASSLDKDGLVPYQQFRRHAVFVPELEDYALSARSFQQLLTECGLHLSGGMGLGDTSILFSTRAHRAAWLPYDSLCSITKLLHQRSQKLHAQIQIEKATAQQELLLSRAAATQPEDAATGYLQSSPAPEALPSAAPITQEPSLASILIPRTADVNNTAVEQAGQASAASSSAQGPQQGTQQAQVDSSITGQPTNQLTVSKSRTAQRLARPQSAHPAVGGHHRPLSAAPRARTAWEADDAIKDASESSPESPSPMYALSTSYHPPVLLREVIPPPPCDMKPVKAKIAGVLDLYRDSMLPQMAVALKDLQQSWQSELQDAAEKAALKRASKAAKSGNADAGLDPSSAAASDSAVQIPLLGRLWLLLMHGCCMMMCEKYDLADRSFQTAENQFDAKQLGVEHPYLYCTLLCQGLLRYYQGQHQQALDKFESARELAVLVGKDKLDITALRNAGVCINNKGVCYQLLGHRSDAVACYKAAHEMLRSAAGLQVLEADVALRNLNRALKQSFALGVSKLSLRRPQSAPSPYLAPYGRGVTTNDRLQAFLRQAITMKQPEPVNQLPAWAQKLDTPQAGKGKKGAAGASTSGRSGPSSKKDTAPKSKAAAFLAMTTYDYPSYSVANTKLEAPKKGKKT